MNHDEKCNWEKTKPEECEYKETHNYCPHEEHACTCAPVIKWREGFHVADGLYFKRLENGDVVITKAKGGRDEDPIEFQIVVTKDAWASTIASVSKLGEQYGRFFLAEKFHNGDDKAEGY